MNRHSPCRDYNELISQYIDGDLSGDERTLLLDHLKTCPECRRTLESYRAIGARLRGMHPVSVPDTLTGDIFAVTINTGPRRLYMLTSRVGYSLAAVAAVVLIFVVAVYLIIGGYQRRIDPEVTASRPGGNVIWPLTEPISITFNKEMDHESVEAALTILPASEHERLVQTVAWQGNTLSIGGGAPLKPGTSYLLSIGSGAEDKWGSRLDEEFELAFTSGPTVALDTPDPVEPTPSPTSVPAPTATSMPEVSGGEGSPQSPPPTPPDNTSVAPTATPEPPPVITQPSGGDDPFIPADPTATEPFVEPTPTATAPAPTAEPTATTPAPTPTAVPPTTTAPPPTATPTLAPVEPTATATLDTIPVSGAFGDVYWGNQAVQDRLGPPLGSAYASDANELDFQRGTMFLRFDTNEIYVLERSGAWSRWTNTSANPPEVEVGPEDGLWTPGGALGELWLAVPSIGESLGFALEESYHEFTSEIQIFERGTMLLSHTGQIYVIYDDLTWEFYTGPGSAE